MVADGEYDSVNNPLKNAPHNLELLLGDYELPYSREVAGYPLEFLKKRQEFVGAPCWKSLCFGIFAWIG